ncbi:MAG: class I SAM-dependent methyltransferase [Kiloniellales bacterium]
MALPTTQETAAQFSRQAEAYAASPSHAGDPDLDIVADFAQAGATEHCLDIATGPGHTAFRIAQSAGFVVGADLAPGMIAAARRLAGERGLANTAFVIADVHRLPFPDAAFDLVTCRIAPHHFADLPAAIRQVARVLRPGGRFVCEDSLGPDDAALAGFLERLEKARDRTHVHSLSRAEWQAALDNAGLSIARETVYRKRHAFDLWIRRTGLAETAIEAIMAEILAAPAVIRASLFEVADGQVATLNDQKLILRAEKPA